MFLIFLLCYIFMLLPIAQPLRAGLLQLYVKIQHLVSPFGKLVVMPHINRTALLN